MTVLSIAPRDQSRCAVAAPCSRRLFWATQPDACPTQVDDCGNTCARLGLTVVDVLDNCQQDCGNPCANTAHIKGRTILTTDWVRGLILNILMTDGQPDESECGVRPGMRGGHWSQIFTGSTTLSFGSRIRHLSVTESISQAPALIATTIELALSRLLTYGVAKSVTCVATYAGRGQVNAVITYVGENDTSSRVLVSGSRISNAWVWN